MLHFDSTKFLDEEDESFVSIDLNDDEDVCDICHQCTNEPTVEVMLSDEFLKFEGSFERTGEHLTKGHQICLDRWADIIERNLKYSTKQTDSDLKSKNFKTLNCNQEMENIYCNINNNDSKTKTSSENFPTMSPLERKKSLKLSSTNMTELKEMISSMQIKITEASSELVDQLQLRDKMCQEVSGQNSVIAQLVELQRKNSVIPNNTVKQLTMRNPVSKTSILV